MKALWTLLALSILGATAAMAELLPDVTYEGKYVTGTKSKVYLMTRKAPGREGSFLGVIQDDGQVALYVIDQASSDEKSYLMTPLDTLDDGGVGIHNDEPSLVLVVREQNNFDITPSNSGNKLGITKSMRFNRRAKGRSWQDATPGRYSRGSVRHALTVSEENEEGVASAQFFSGLEGSYVVLQQFPGIYAVLVRKYLKWGEQVQRSPQKIGVFLKVKGKERFFLLNPQSGTNMTFKAHGEVE